MPKVTIIIVDGGGQVVAARVVAISHVAVIVEHQFWSLVFLVGIVKWEVGVVMVVELKECDRTCNEMLN